MVIVHIIGVMYGYCSYGRGNVCLLFVFELHLYTLYMR